MVDKTSRGEYRKIIEMTAMIDRIAEEIIETTIEMTVMIEGGTGLEKGHFPETIVTIL